MGVGGNTPRITNESERRFHREGPQKVGDDPMASEGSELPSPYGKTHFASNSSYNKGIIILLLTTRGRTHPVNKTLGCSCEFPSNDSCDRKLGLVQPIQTADLATWRRGPTSCPHGSLSNAQVTMHTNGTYLIYYMRNKPPSTSSCLGFDNLP